MGGHITDVRVTHGPATVGDHRARRRDPHARYYHFWIDTNSTNPGPEYKAEVYQNSAGHT